MFVNGLRAVREPRRLVMTFLLSFPLWLAIGLGIYLVTRAYHMDMPFQGSFVVMAILVIGSWAFILEPTADGRTRFFNRERDMGWIRLAAPRRSGLLRAAGALVDYVVGEPLHSAMVRRMMLGIKQRAEASWREARDPSLSAAA